MSKRRHGNYHQGLILEISPQALCGRLLQWVQSSSAAEPLNSVPACQGSVGELGVPLQHARSTRGEHPVLLSAFAVVSGMSAKPRS